MRVYRRRPDYRAKPSNLFALLAIASAASGSAALAITPTGTLTGAGVLAGTCAISVGASATPSGSNVTGSAAITVEPTGTLTAVASIAGTAALTFENSGTLIGAVAYPNTLRLRYAKWRTQPVWHSQQLNRLVIFPYSQSSGISGQADVIFTPVATLAASGRLLGASGNVLSATGTLIGTGAQLGSAAITITPTGQITETPTGSVTGTSVLTLDGLATLRGAGRLLGVAANQFSATLITGSVQPISGASEFIFTIAGTIRGSIPEIDTPRSRTLFVRDRRFRR